MENRKLRPELYWEWRCSVNEMDLAKKELDVAALKYECMVKDQEIARLKTNIFKMNLNSLQDKATQMKEEYEKMKKRIEDEIGTSLNGCVIDDINFEVKKLDDEVKS